MIVEEKVAINVKYCQVLHKLSFSPRIVTDPRDCILAHTSAVAQLLGTDTSAKIHSHASVMGMCVLEKTTLKRAWSK